MSIEVVNTEQAAAWDGHEGDVWTEQADRYDRASRRIWQRFVERKLIGRADRVVDVGCGTGGPTRDVARSACEGEVTGIDLSTRMLELARQRSAAEGLDNVTFVRGDAQVFPFESEAFDVAMSSFGTMFFNDPVAAYTNIGGGMRRSGTLALLAWRTLQDNGWLMSLRGALAVGRQLPVPPPHAPTPFALAEPERVHTILGSAGFDDIELEPIDELIDLGTDAVRRDGVRADDGHRRGTDRRPRPRSAGASDVEPRRPVRRAGDRRWSAPRIRGVAHHRSQAMSDRLTRSI